MKQRSAVMLGFKGFTNSVITIADIELLHRIRKGQFGLRHLRVQGRAALQCGTRCFGPELCTATQRWSACVGYLH